jgi:hypothetical protein
LRLPFVDNCHHGDHEAIISAIAVCYHRRKMHRGAPVRVICLHLDAHKPLQWDKNRALHVTAAGVDLLRARLTIPRTKFISCRCHGFELRPTQCLAILGIEFDVSFDQAHQSGIRCDALNWRIHGFASGSRSVHRRRFCWPRGNRLRSGPRRGRRCRSLSGRRCASGSWLRRGSASGSPWGHKRRLCWLRGNWWRSRSRYGRRCRSLSGWRCASGSWLRRGSARGSRCVLRRRL